MGRYANALQVWAVGWLRHESATTIPRARGAMRIMKAAADAILNAPISDAVDREADRAHHDLNRIDGIVKQALAQYDRSQRLADADPTNARLVRSAEARLRVLARYLDVRLYRVTNMSQGIW
jgi:hypothetical protein